MIKKKTSYKKVDYGKLEIKVFALEGSKMSLRKLFGYKGGELTGKGKWHGRFERVYFPIGTMETDEYGNLRKKAIK